MSCVGSRERGAVDAGSIPISANLFIDEMAPAIPAEWIGVPSANFLDIHRSALIAVLYARFYGLSDIDALHQILPGCRIGQIVHQPVGLVFYAFHLHCTIS